MGDDKIDVKKYQNDKNIEMNIILKNHVLIPATKIEGTIELTPKKDIKLKKNDHKISFKITQFEMINYDYESLGGDKEEKSKNKEAIIIEKTIYHFFPDNSLQEGKAIKIDFSFYLPGDENEKFYPTFEFREKNFLLYIRHLLTIEIPSFETSNSTGLIIGKLPKRQFEFEEKDFSIYNEIVKDKEKISYKFKIKKASCPLDGEIPIKLDIDASGLKKLEIKSVEIILEQLLKVKWVLTSKIKPWGDKNEEKKITINNIKYEEEKIKEKMNIVETIKIKEDDIPNFDEKNIERFIKFDEDFLEYDKKRMELTPSVNTDLFLSEYKLYVKFELNKKINSKNHVEKELVIDFYTLKPKIIDDFLEHYFNEKENPSFNSQDEPSFEKPV